jgi:sugar (pentulose or hexulose) kinase
MRPSDGPGEIVRAALAGLAHRIGDIFEAGARTLPRSGAVVLSGPLAGIPGFAGFFADVLARPVRVAREPEATLRGIARLAGRGVSGRHFPADRSRYSGEDSRIPSAAVGPITEPRLSRNDRDACRARWRRALRASRSSALPRS